MLADRIKEIIDDCGFQYTERPRTIYTSCPLCGSNKKFSILKENGASICYRGSCDFGRRWFEDWIALTKNISRFEAKQILHGNGELGYSIDEKNTLDLSNPFDFDFMSDLEPINWPPPLCVNLSSTEAKEGVQYLNGRGIPCDVAERHNIVYCPVERRVTIPMTYYGTCYGYQGRAIDPVSPGFRMRNNINFRKDRMLAFFDQAMDYEHLIITEGPFDAMKFANLGGYVSTLGKNISKHQIELMHQLKPKAVFIALDEDATKEAFELANSMRDVNRKVYITKVTESCRLRCNKEGRKYDFGECSFEEAVKSIKESVRIY